MLPAPGFHHLHLNSVDPAAAIDFYTRQFASTSTSSWGGLPALASPNNVLLLFSKVATPPATTPQSAIWHFGWHVTDVRKSLGTYREPAGRQAPPALHHGRRRLRSDQQRYLAAHRQRARIDQGGDRRRQGQRRHAEGRQRLRVSARSRRRHRGVSGQPAGRAHEPRAHVAGAAVLCAALVSRSTSTHRWCRDARPRRRGPRRTAGWSAAPTGPGPRWCPRACSARRPPPLSSAMSC